MDTFTVKTDLRETNYLPEYFYKEVNTDNISNHKEGIPFIQRAKIHNPLEIRKLYFSYQNTCTDLRGIEDLKNLEDFCIVGAAADMESLSKCRKLKSIIIYDPCMIHDLECFLSHPSIQIIDLRGYLTNYDSIEVGYLINEFKKRGVTLNAKSIQKGQDRPDLYQARL